MTCESCSLLAFMEGPGQRLSLAGEIYKRHLPPFVQLHKQHHLPSYVNQERIQSIRRSPGCPPSCFSSPLSTLSEPLSLWSEHLCQPSWPPYSCPLLLPIGLLL